MQIREVKHSDWCVACGQDGHLGLAKLITHDYLRIVGHEKIQLLNSSVWSNNQVGLKETLKSDLTEAIRSSDKVVSGTIRMVLTAITNEEVSGKEARTLSEDEIIAVLSREAKKRREAAEEFAKGNRPEKAAEEKAEGEVIAKYLPAQLTEADIAAMIAEAIAATGAAGPAGSPGPIGPSGPQGLPGNSGTDGKSDNTNFRVASKSPNEKLGGSGIKRKFSISEIESR